MKLQLNNIGMIRKADIAIDGLTVIAGENDSGKSTIGKILFSLIKADMISLLKFKRKQASNLSENRKRNFDTQISLNFKNQITKSGTITFISENYKQHIAVTNNKTEEFSVLKEMDTNISDIEDADLLRVFTDAIFIQTPFIWDLMDTFRGIANFKAESELLGLSTHIPFPYILWDLYVKLTNTSEKESAFDETYDIESIINGRFEKNFRGDFKFIRNDLEIEVVNVAAGIRSFGLLQVLLDNHQIYRERVLIFDEPEVHLHPKWQIEMAKIIVWLVENGVKVLVNSHSPYMIEALESLSKEKSILSNFYLSKKENHLSDIESVGDDLTLIYNLLSQPIDTLEEMELESFRW